MTFPKYVSNHPRVLEEMKDVFQAGKVSRRLEMESRPASLLVCSKLTSHFLFLLLGDFTFCLGGSPLFSHPHSQQYDTVVET